MIHEIGVELAAALKAKGYAAVVVDGPEATGSTSFARERIVIEHDADGTDKFGPALSQHKNPKQRMTRGIAAKLTIYAQTTTAGAMPFEHRRRAEHILDMVLVAMDGVAIARKNKWTPTGGKFVTPPDLAGSDAFAGASYALTFTFDRGVFDATWAGASRPEAAVGVGGVSITNTTNVTQANGPDGEDVETGCGG